MYKRQKTLIDQIIKKQTIVTILVAVIITLVYLFRINVMQTPYYSDELGYWAAGAWMQGIDWSPVISHSPYYGWGYGIILAPLFCISNSLLRFPVAVFINIVMMIGSYLLLVSINGNLFPQTPKHMIPIVSGTTMLYSYNIVYAHLTMAESFLILLFLLSVKEIINICEKGTIKNFLFFAIILGMQMSVHLRTIIFVFAGILVIGYLIYYKQISIKKIVIIAMVIPITLTFVFMIKNKLILFQYTVPDVNISRPLGNESFSQQFSKLKYFVSFDTWKRLFYSVLGKFFYLGCASFLFLFIGIRYLLQTFILSLKVKRNFDRNVAIILYIVVSFSGAFFLDAEAVMYGTRFDHIFYGRYIENVIPVMISIGLLTVINYGIKVKEIVLYALCMLASSIILYYFMKKNNFSGALPLESSGFAGIMIEENLDYGTQFTIHAALITTFLAVIIYIILKKKKIICCVLLGIIWSVIAYRGLRLCAYPELERQNLIIETAHEIEILDKKVWTLLPDDALKSITVYVDVLWLQYHLGNQTVYTVSLDSFDCMEKGDLLVIDRYYPDSEVIANQYQNVWENNRMYIIEIN